MLPPPGSREDPRWQESWDYLCRLYRPAMVRYVRTILTRARGRPVGEDEAADVVQDYLTQALEKGWLDRDGEEIRCFRAYLQAQLSNFAISHVRHESAQKRTPKGTEPAEVLEHVAAGSLEPTADEFDTAWVETITDHVIDRLRDLNETYHAIIVDLTHTHGTGSEDIADQLGCPASRMKGLRHRARRRLALLFFEEMRMSVRDEEAYESLFHRLAPYLP